MLSKALLSKALCACLICPLQGSDKRVRTRILSDKGSDAKSCNSALRPFGGPVVILPPTPPVHDMSASGHVCNVTLRLRQLSEILTDVRTNSCVSNL